MIQNNSKGQLTAQVNLGDKVRSGFRFDYPYRGSGRIGRIYNTRCEHVFPSDKKEGSSPAAVQFEPLAVPILANMYFHQEHFYVPENTLWDNFDKFISGGQKLDYQGKKPSVSLKRMFNAFFSLVSDDEDVYPVWFDLPQRNNNVFISRYDIENMLKWSLRNNTGRFNLFLIERQMLDLCEYMEDVTHDLGKALQAISSTEGEDSDINSGEVRLFTKGYLYSGVDANVNKYCWNETNPNPYLRKIAKSIVNVYDSANNGQGMEYIIPTDAGMIFLEYLYEFIKPFFGYSSYLDNMNYNKLTFDNFVYIVMCSISYSYSDWNAQTNIELALSEAAQFLSDYSQDILPLRAQYSVWWNNYRDQLLEYDAMEPRTTDAVNSDEIFTLLAPRVRCWHKDTFTTALDNPGTGGVGVPVLNNMLGDYESFAQILDGDNSGVSTIDSNNIAKVIINDKTWNLPTAYLRGINPVSEESTDTSVGISLYSIDAARRAQKWLQRALFYGNRIQDFLYTHFGVKYLDARLRLPELLTTSTQLVQLTDVINNTNIKSEDGTVAVAGDRACIAHGYDKKGGYIDRYCEEHGFIISCFSVMPDVTYANTFDRSLAMLDQFDYPFPEFATLGMDAVYDIELAQLPVKVMEREGVMNITDSPQVFGYQGRYYNHKTHLGEEHGELLDKQDMYTFARDFNIYDPETRPKLNYIFVHCHPVLDMFVVNNKYSDYFRYDIFFNGGADRPFPAHSLVI